MAKTSLYIRLVKRARRFLRNKYMRKLPWLTKLLKPLFDREYWEPTPHRMALGLSIGLFFAFAMLIIPIQMFCSAIVCLFLRANLPIALGACWLSNPFTIPPLIYAMVWVGSKFEYCGIRCGNSEFTIFDVTVNYAHFIIGCLSCGIGFAVLAYPLYMLGWFLWPKKKTVVGS